MSNDLSRALDVRGHAPAAAAGIDFNPENEPTCDPVKTVGYIPASADRQAELGVSLEAQETKTTVHNAELIDVMVDGDESAKSLNRPGLQRLLANIVTP